MSTHLKEIAAGKSLDRSEILTLLQVALQAGEERFVRELAEDWLDAYPYDLPVELLRAHALIQQTKSQKALGLLLRITKLDPEFYEAQDLLARLARRVQPQIAESARAAAVVVSRPQAVPNDIEEWGRALIQGQLALKKDDLNEAETHIQTALLAKPPSPLPGLMHVQLARLQDMSWLAVRKLIELYRQQWPHALQFQLMLAEQLIESGQEDEAVDILHQCVAEDVTGQVARRLWGEEHRFSALWPRSLHRAVRIAIPAKVAAGMGWNHLSEGLVIAAASMNNGKSAPDVDNETQVSPDSLEDGQPEASAHAYESSPLGNAPETPLDIDELTTQNEEDLQLRADGRNPSYVILSTRVGLEKQYGFEGARAIETAMMAVVATTAANPSWSACMVYADDKNSLSPYGLESVAANDPWAIKLLLADLDEALRAKGEMIGAVLIVGGPKVVPFHRLPNPVDDEDKDVASDNPYGSIDENYFVPSWPLGRLPGTTTDHSSLVKALNRIAASRANAPLTSQAIGLLARLLSLFNLWKPKRKTFGYSAEIWQRASHSVYRPIGEPRKLSISPPTETGRLPKAASTPLQLAYFNLHGIEDGPDWYGQRDPLESPAGPDYPVALTPKDVINSGRAPQIVFSEACFGANIAGKTAETALALKFLESGSKAVVGSTCTSYGSVKTPLIAADLLGQTFWKLLNEGHPVGEALRRAKIALARSMHRRQGYLDGEDQKTLISFLLYGDPLAVASATGSVPKGIMRPALDSEEMLAVCDKAEKSMSAPQDIPAQTLATVKSIVQEYLPGMLESSMQLSHEHLNCQGHNCPLPHGRAKALPGLAPNRQLVTLSKNVKSGNRQHPSYARITMDAHGKVVKLAVSR
ncbi:MAG: hypothetical protein DWG76_01485 [Chloroflexi bacterium]|nr:hypothetical protein [Chloroflexota bacterium]